ncbi:MAG: hypothetical protein U1F43_32975 [Myxococcota bacterium]
MGIARTLRDATPAELRQRITTGYPVDPRALDGFIYRGTSLGLPPIAQRLTWRTFQKTFWREPRSGRLLGWNVRLEQDGEDAPSRPILDHGRPRCVWHYEVIEPRGVPMPPDFDRGLVIDYSRGENRPWDPIRLSKDPLVALAAGDPTELIGVSYLVIGGRCIETPTYFTLEREGPITFVPYDAPSGG